MSAKQGVARPDCVAFIVPVTANDRLYSEGISRLDPSLYSDEEYHIRRSYEIKSSDMVQMLSESGLLGFISPLHIPEGDDMQYHFHVMICRPARQGFAFPKWREICSALGALNGYVEALQAPHEYSRYLIHLGYSDKIQYCACDVLSVGLNYEVYSKQLDWRSSIDTDENNILNDILDYITDYQVFVYSDLVDFARHKSPNWLPFVVRQRAFFLDYMKSQNYSFHMQLKALSKRI